MKVLPFSVPNAPGRDYDDPRSARLAALPFASQVRLKAEAEARVEALAELRAGILRDVLHATDLVRTASACAAPGSASEPMRSLHTRCYRRLHGAVTILGGKITHGDPPARPAVELVREAGRLLRAARRRMNSLPNCAKAAAHVAFVLDALAAIDEPDVKVDVP